MSKNLVQAHHDHQNNLQNDSTRKIQNRNFNKNCKKNI